MLLIVLLMPYEQLQKMGFFFLLFLYITDVIDGAVARRYNVTTKFGFLLDALGDMGTSFVCYFSTMIYVGYNPAIVYLFIMRDMAGFAFLAYEEKWQDSIKPQRYDLKIPYGIVKTIYTMLLMLCIWDINTVIENSYILEYILWILALYYFASAIYLMKKHSKNIGGIQ